MLKLSSTALVVEVKQYETSKGEVVTQLYLLDPDFRSQPFVVYGSDRIASRWVQNFSPMDIVEYTLEQELAHFDNGMTDCMIMDRVKLKHWKF